MTDLSQIVRDLAVITAVRQILDAREKEVKAADNENEFAAGAYWQGRGDERWRTVSSEWPVIA